MSESFSDNSENPLLGKEKSLTSKISKEAFL